MSLSTPAAQLRKVKKPLIERRRRERINEYLNELMTLVYEATGTKSPKSTSKMEKAEILEMTVDYLRKLRRKTSDAKSTMSVPTSSSTGTDNNNSNIDESPHPQSQCSADDVRVTPGSSSSSSTQEYVAGFGECARLVRRFLTQQHSGNGFGSSNMLSEVVPVRDVSHILWNHLSEHVSTITSPSLQRSPNIANDQHFRAFIKSFTSEVTSSIIEPATTSCVVSEAVVHPTLLTKSHPAFRMLATSPIRLSVPDCSLPLATSSINSSRAVPLYDVTLLETMSIPQCNRGLEYDTSINTSMFPASISPSAPTRHKQIDSVQHDNQSVWRPWGTMGNIEDQWGTMAAPVDENGNYIKGTHVGK